MKRRTRFFALSMAVCMLYQVCFPVVAFALTGGPSQPEVESFEPVGTSEMVDVFSGDFNYNIPLLDVDGYPVNLAYHSGITMDQEASWVGLGWNLNPGVISRNMRGIPDEFSGDKISKIQYVKPNYTFGLTQGAGIEILGKAKEHETENLLQKSGVNSTLSFGIGINYNNYTGLGIESSISPAISAGDKSKGNLLTKLGLNARLDLASSSKEGLSIRPGLGISPVLKNMQKGDQGLNLSHNTSVAAAINSRSGVKSLTIQSNNSFSGSKTNTSKDEKSRSNKALVGSVSNSSTISYGTQTYVPGVSQAMVNSNFSINFKIGFEFMALNPHFSASGYFAGQRIEEVKAEREAYGNIYAHNYEGKDDAMLDFNREKDGVFSNRNPVLAIPVYTNDLYAASGQGVAGSFKAYRNDIPAVHDPKLVNKSTGGATGPEFGLGNTFKVGLNFSINRTNVRGGAWKDGNSLRQFVNFGKGSIDDKPFYEASYFKSIGEKAEVTETNNLPYFEIDKGAVRPALEQKGSSSVKANEAETKQAVVNKAGQEKALGSLDKQMHQDQRDKRNTLMTTRTKAEGNFCVNRQIRFYRPLENPKQYPVWAYDRVSYNANIPGHHLSELGVTKPDGARYVYGIPAYNNEQYEISFTHADDPDDSNDPSMILHCDKGQVDYSTMDMSDDNILSPIQSQISGRKKKGIDHAYNVTRIPAYAHSYLLTDVLSPDYVDVNNDGPSTNDYGSYTHISYYKTADNYKWRVPYNENMANYNEGLKSDKTDDNANILYGEKETWLVARIEGKDHIAIFHISKRQDGYGVNGPNGSLGEDGASYKLDKIELYARTDMETPIKTVHFEYDYSLCGHVDNNFGGNPGGNINQNQGKLTLKKLYFTYRKSTKGRFNAYTFVYDAINPDYNLKGYDRWGNYKPNPMVTEPAMNCNIPSHDYPLSNADFPYVDQDKFSETGPNKADVYAAAWHLTKINLPSGGTIEVEYEADDYAYVQDKRAAQMAKILGFCDYSSTMSTPTTTLGSISYSNTLYDEKDPKECILFDLPAELDAEDYAAVARRLKDGFNEYLYYNCLVNLTSSDKGDFNYEYVRGYTDIADAGVINMNNGRPVGWVKVNPKGGGDEHPISRTAWQFARMYLPQLVYPGSNLKKKSNGANVAQAIIRGLAGFLPEAVDMVEGVNNKLRRKEYGKHVLTSKSWIRIENLLGRQLGGGSRVKQLLLRDNWQTQSGSGANASYGQVYKYTMHVRENGQDRIISSGVASYEPAAGGDENACKRPVVYDKNNIGVPNDEFYSEEPFGESYYPAPSVGYSRVEVRNFIPAEAEGKVNTHGTGKVVHLYYTAKDFPVLTSMTTLDARSFESSGLFSVLGFKTEQDMTMSQGFQVELNDMHGRPKATLNYDQAHIESYEDRDAFSGIRYNYEVDESSAQPKLKNTFMVVDKSNHIREALVGVESEMVMDSRQQQSETYAGNISINLDWYLLGGLPTFGFSVFPGYSSEATKYKSAVLARVVNRFGLLKSTEAFEEGSSIKTENMLLDAETGEVLLTRTYNEYRDPVYNLTMPAHWAYDGMGQAYKNTGLKIPIKKKPGEPMAFVTDISGHADPAEYFSDGDMVRFEGSAYSNLKFYVQRADDQAGTRWYILDAYGTILPMQDAASVATIMQSGRKNMQSLPTMQVTSLGNLMSSGTRLDFTGKEVLNASAVTYSDQWRRMSNHGQVDGKVRRMKELIEIANYLFSSGQLTTANVNSLLGSNHAINTTHTGHGAVTNSELYNSCSSSLGFAVNSMPSLTIGYSCGILGTNTMGILDNETKAALRLSDGITGNDIVPTHYEFVEASVIQLGGDDQLTIGVSASVITTYLDANNQEQKITSQIQFEIGNLATVCDDPIGYTHNPFRSGTEGNWRKQCEWVFYGDRTQASAINLRKDGSFTSFTPYWNNALQADAWSATGNAAWTATSEATKYSPNGDELENKDALGRYSAAMFSTRFAHTAIAVAGNARYSQIGTEDVEQPINLMACPQKALDFELEVGDYHPATSHTGKYSIRLNAQAQRTAAYRIIDESGPYDNGKAQNRIDRNSLNGLFNPPPGKYVVGAWVRMDNSSRDATYHQSATSAHIEVSVLNGLIPVPVSFYPKGQIIEGWQRVEGTFEVSANTKSVSFKLAADQAKTSYFDDIRVHPFDARMKTYVYDDVTQRLTAELDDNNYATFYEYSAEGQLIRVKKETEKGIVTLKEVRSNQRKVNP